MITGGFAYLHILRICGRREISYHWVYGLGHISFYYSAFVELDIIHKKKKYHWSKGVCSCRKKTGSIKLEHVVHLTSLT